MTISAKYRSKAALHQYLDASILVENSRVGRKTTNKHVTLSFSYINLKLYRRGVVSLQKRPIKDLMIVYIELIVQLLYCIVYCRYKQK